MRKVDLQSFYMWRQMYITENKTALGNFIFIEEINKLYPVMQKKLFNNRLLIYALFSKSCIFLITMSNIAIIIIFFGM